MGLASVGAMLCKGQVTSTLVDVGRVTPELGLEGAETPQGGT